jgi:phospholipid transport system substrate-binding protein
MGRRIDALARAALTVLAAMLVARSVTAADLATDTADATIATLHRGLVQLAADKPNATVEERYRALVPLIEATHDLPYIAEFALRRQWPMLSAADRERFLAAFERLSVTTYASRFKNVTAATFESTAAATAADNGRMQVTTSIARPNAAAVSLDYLLQQHDGSWKIINIVADGVSDLALKRAEYQRLLASGTLDDLIKELDAQTARLR